MKCAICGGEIDAMGWTTSPLCAVAQFAKLAPKT